MKCVKNIVDMVPLQIKKVEDKKAVFLVDHGPWDYISKSEYRRIKAQQEPSTKEND
ncbi:MAG: hypothetical protein KAT35_05505 [Candidatus Aenigmarchaeota archaeon]|nr:hypothetical protein [Candidatus Aenigmarchaeota archaeon]